MALKSIKVTTSQIADAITANKIGAETSVTITDNLYNSTALLALIAVTDKTITLVYTAAGTPIEAAPEDLEAILKQVNKYTGPLTVTGTTTTAEQLNYIAKKTTGKVTATLDPDTSIKKATVDALKDVSSSDNIAFAPEQTLVEGKAALEALVALNKKLSVDWSKVTHFEGTASEVAAIKAAIKVVPTAAVDIDGPISAADAAAIAKLSGALKATIKDGSVAATLKAIKDVVDTANDNLTFKTTDKTVKATDLVALNTLVTLDAISVTTVTGDAKDTADILLALGIATNPEVKISGIVAINDLSIGDILDGTNKKVTAKIAAGEASDLVTLLTNGTDKDALDVTVNGTDATAAQLAGIYDKTALKVKVDAATVTAANFDAFEDVYVINKNKFSSLGDENIIIDSAATLNSAQADIVAKATSKVVTATVSAATADLLVENLKNANAKDALTLTVNGATASAKDLLTLDGKTSITVVATTPATITGSVAEINKLLVADVTLNANPSFELTGTVKAADANYIALNTTGVVTATIAADTAAKLDAALTEVPPAVNAYKLTVNGATAAATDLIALNDKTSEKITLTAKEITGTAADVTIVLNTAVAEISGQEKAAVKVTDEVKTTDIGAILTKADGIVTATVKAATATDLKTPLTNAKATDKLTLKVINAAGATDAADLNYLDDKTAVKVDASAVTAISGTAAELKKLVAAKGVEIAKGVNITVTGDVKASDLATILKSTLGKVTATDVTADTAAALNKALTDKDVNALTLKVNGTTATAKDLISLDGKTSVAIQLKVGAITGNIAEITKVFVDSTTDNFDDVTGVAATISGTITAAEAKAIADVTGKVVTATIAADTAAALNTALQDTNTNAYKLTIKGDYTNSANALDLVELVGTTSVTVNAAAIKNIEGTGANGAEEVRDAYLANAKKDISGLGNETVDLSKAGDANAALVKAINDYTTGLITLPTITFDKAAVAGTTFDLKQLGDLNGITGLVNIDAKNTQDDTISISLKDLLAANDSKGNFTFKVTGDNGGNDEVSITNDLSGWTQTKSIAAEHTYTNGKTGQVVTIELVDAVFAV
jgi:hypothetical protein